MGHTSRPKTRMRYLKEGIGRKLNCWQDYPKAWIFPSILRRRARTCLVSVPFIDYNVNEVMGWGKAHLILFSDIERCFSDVEEDSISGQKDYVFPGSKRS